jgi:uncharacterized protein (TIGR02246 family)
MPVHLDQLKSTFDSFSDAWRTNDGAAVASFFAEDGAIISPFGQRAEGRTAIAAMYSEHFGGMLRGTSTTFNLSSVRPIEGNHAFADGEQTIHGPDGQVILAVHVTALLRREEDRWRVIEARPYAFAPMPA